MGSFVHTWPLTPIIRHASYMHVALWDRHLDTSLLQRDMDTSEKLAANGGGAIEIVDPRVHDKI